MTESSGRSIVNFGGTLWWVLIKFCSTKLNEEQTKEKTVRNFIFLGCICYVFAFVTIKMIPPDPLYVVDGVIVTKTEFEKHKPIEIESVNVIKEESSKVIYGDNGRNGAVLMTLKHRVK